ncbi:FecR family protein [Pedobacter africanus]|uniref:FecR family protein n=1 Tax=Pedobacter africanus TaxID=151894 RepID=A0A1W1ZF31_9SPHI|nr:FecR family protein [Pedobacter africanus]SMC47135.1 FecR family protein [Pedobacter africanus]
MKYKAKSLFEKYQSGNCSPDEKAVVENWLTFGEATKLDLTEAELDDDLQVLHKRINTIPAGKGFKNWPRIGIAAAVIGIALCTWLYRSYHPGAGQDPALAKYKKDIAPGGNRAVLTAANGKTITLSAAKTGIAVSDEIKYNDGTKIDPSALGINHPLSTANEKELALNIATPRGGTYSIILQDGTKVWLNADSKLEFLSNYWNKAQRIVKLIGEAYFEVAKDAKRPFIVQSAGQKVTVLGTHFNISAYKGEAIKTTLLEGTVRVTPSGPTPSSRVTGGSVKDEDKNSEAVVLKPSQQTTLDKTFKIRLQTLLDAEHAIAWAGIKDKPVFMFRNENLPSLLRKISRWYDVETIDQTTKKNYGSFNGAIQRDSPLSVMVKMLEATQTFHFRIEGRKLIVTDWR